MGDGSGLRFPVAHEFSPGQVDLRRILTLVAENEGDRSAIVEAIRGEYFSKAAARRKDPNERLKQQQERSANILRGMGPNGYQLFDLASNTLTDAGRALFATEDESALHSMFAEHILRDVHGVSVLEAVRGLQDRGIKVTKASLSAELKREGYVLPTATTHHTTMIGWLRQCGVVGDHASIDEAKIADLLGMDLGTIGEWQSLSDEQQAFLKSLRSAAEIDPEGFTPLGEVLAKAIAEHGPIFKEDQLRRNVTAPLDKMGWLELEVKDSGRGGKGGSVRATDKLLDLDMELLGQLRAWGIPADLRAKLNTPLDKIHKDLKSASKNIKGIALELLAVRMASDLSLTPLAFRLRSAETGGAEVDLIAEAAHLHFSRWLFQCKNVAGKVHLSDLAKEIGMAVMLRAHVVVMVTTGEFSETVRTYAQELMETNQLQVVLVDGGTVRQHLKEGPPALLKFFHSEASRVMALKRSQLFRDGSES